MIIVIGSLGSVIIVMVISMQAASSDFDFAKLRWHGHGVESS
jgi:hypothetical protein